MYLLIKNGAVVSPEGRTHANVGVENGKIVSITAPDGADVKADRVIDAAGLYILPGCIEAHGHFRDPGHTNKEDFVTGSMAAAAGGITTVFEMANNKPLMDGKQELMDKRKLIEGRSYIDYCLHGLVNQRSIGRLIELREAGARGFKAMMSISAMGTPTVDDGELLQAMRELYLLDAPLTVHAENTSIITSEQRRLMALGRTDWRAHMESRPVISEVDGISRAVLLAGETGVRLHIAHIAAGRSVEVIRAAKRRGVKVTCETGPHNLTLTDADYERLGPSMFMNPPVRTRYDQDMLFQGIWDGTVDMISTDHAPHTEEEKFGANNVWKSISGLCGIETSVPVMLTLVNQGRISLEKYVEISSRNQARHFGIYPQKGAIKVGSDADFTVVDIKKTGTIRKAELKSKTKITPFDGFVYTGAPVYTIVRGHVVMENGVVNVEQRIGKLV